MYKVILIMSDFFEEFQQLREKTPQIGFHGFQNTNSEYCDFLYHSKNSYLCFASDYQDTCLYVYSGYKNKQCADCFWIKNSELLYECVDCQNCYNSSYLQDCKQTSESYLGFDLIGCSDCFGCVGLRHKQYHIFNKPFSKTDYEKNVVFLKKQPLEKLYSEFEKIKVTMPHLSARQYQSENCIGDYLLKSKNCYFGFDVEGFQDSGYAFGVYNIYGERSADTWDVNDSVDLQLCYQGHFLGKGYNCNFCFYCEFVRDCEYCDSCFHSEKLFGCVGLNKRKFCILNKEYSEDEYYKEVARIKGEMREKGQYGNWPDGWKMREANSINE